MTLSKENLEIGMKFKTQFFHYKNNSGSPIGIWIEIEIIKLSNKSIWFRHTESHPFRNDVKKGDKYHSHINKNTFISELNGNRFKN